ncbi:MAG: methylated-DNA--[protein]-cysteine S-methyltransferase [Alphaproteobacteria bacterium]|nr:methylated-DNA--[protein]-cysteine S-methyltransferase [Alphaproteobacteria bacterium]
MDSEILAVKIDKIDAVLGVVLVAASRQGVRYIALGDDSDAVQMSLRQYYARLKRGFVVDNTIIPPDTLQKWSQAVMEMCRGNVIAELPPMEIIGTDLQQKIWAELLKIPRGEVLTYKQLGEKIAVHQRVVGTLGMGKNPLAVIIPCHRVVYQDRKKPDSYGFGRARKIELLRREGVARYVV